MNSRIIQSAVNGECTYELMESELLLENSVKHKVYGIGIHNADRGDFIEDISDDKEAIRKLFTLMVEEQLYPEHLLDVAEDFVNEY